MLTDSALWGAHHDLTGPVPMSWPEALELLSAELGEPVTFRVSAERQFLERAGSRPVQEAKPSTSRTASTKACGASWGRLCPIPPVMVRWAYLPENFAA